MNARQKTIYIDTKKCMNCRACETACKVENELPAGPRYIMVSEVELTVDGIDKCEFMPLSCMHCGDPACMKACPVGAISKREKDGIVLVDKNKCIGCHQCLWACEFGAPQFGEDNKMEKCNLCYLRLDMGLPTACEAACQAEAIMVGTMDQISRKLRERYATVSREQLFLEKAE